MPAHLGVPRAAGLGLSMVDEHEPTTARPDELGAAVRGERAGNIPASKPNKQAAERENVRAEHPIEVEVVPRVYRPSGVLNLVEYEVVLVHRRVEGRPIAGGGGERGGDSGELVHRGLRLRLEPIRPGDDGPQPTKQRRKRREICAAGSADDFFGEIVGGERGIETGGHTDPSSAEHHLGEGRSVLDW
jgi:hypothetical protein